MHDGNCTFLFLTQVVEVFQHLGVGLDTVHLPRLQTPSTKPRQVAPPPVLLAQQQVDPAVGPLGGSPRVTAQTNSRRVLFCSLRENLGGLSPKSFPVETLHC